MFADRIIERAEKLIDTAVGSFTIMAAVTEEPVSFAEREKLKYREFRLGETWGELFFCAWFHLRGKIDLPLSAPVYLKLDLNCEALLFDSVGNPVKGFTNGSSAFGAKGRLETPAKRYYPLKDFISSRGDIELWIDAGMNDLFGSVKNNGVIEIVQMINRNFKARELYYDLHCLSALMKASKSRDSEAYRIYRSNLQKIYVNSGIPDAVWIDESLLITNRLLRMKTKSTHQISSIGHAHIDLAWLWPIRETKRKGARTFAGVLRLMELYEDFIFGASQPQLYKWIKEQYPLLYDEIRKRIEEGRWEVLGGMWVEADTNIPGEESLVRQMLYGIRYFQEEFGVRVNSLWLPDVFGYSGNLPQIIKKSGLEYFMTNKLSWNDTNKFPYHSFHWAGIDGSQILTHMPPEGEYNSPANVPYLLKSMEDYKESGISKNSLNLFGVGDGGGGPSASHIERIRRLGGTAPIANVKMETSGTFFKKLSVVSSKLPLFSGELYLEKHRGTYTSQGRVKFYNRKLENKLKTLETLLIHCDKSGIYKREITNIWQEILLYQFHDILPGSSIKRVYDECLARYSHLDEEIDRIASEALGTDLSDDNMDIDISDLRVFNPLPVKATVIEVTADTFREFHLDPLSDRIQSSCSWKKTNSGNPLHLENRYLKVTFHRDGSICTIFDKEINREILRGSGNQLRVYRDTSDAWNIYRHYRLLPSAKMKLITSESHSYGPVREIVQHYKYKKSHLTLTIRLRRESRCLNFSINTNWNSLKRMLRTSFPLNLTADKAVFDIQFGHLLRSSKNGTSSEKAQYEACGQNWVDMNNGKWGAALFTDCKYGYRAKENTLDLNLIKSTDYPCRNGDIGNHEIQYALYIHKGDFADGKVDALAMEFNSWFPHYRKGIQLCRPFFSLSSENITYSSVKESEDGKSIIIRLYERNGLEEDCLLIINRPVNGIFETNLVEENPVELCSNPEILLHFSPFEIRTLMIDC